MGENSFRTERVGERERIAYFEDFTVGEECFLGLEVESIYLNKMKNKDQTSCLICLESYNS